MINHLLDYYSFHLVSFGTKENCLERKVNDINLRKEDIDKDRMIVKYFWHVHVLPYAFYFLFSRLNID